MAVPVVVEKAASRSPPVAASGNTRILRNVFERAVAVVAIQDVLAPITHEEIVESIVVEVPNAAPLAPSRVRQAGFAGDIRECAVPVVVEQVASRGSATSCSLERGAVDDENVRPAIVVVVEEGDAPTHHLQQEPLIDSVAELIDGLVHSSLRADVYEIRGGCRFGPGLAMAAQQFR